MRPSDRYLACFVFLWLVLAIACFSLLFATIAGAQEKPDHPMPKPNPESTRTWALTNGANFVATYALYRAERYGAGRCNSPFEASPQYFHDALHGTRRVLEIGVPVDVGIAVASKLVGKKHPGLAKGLALFSATGQAGAALPIRLAGCT